MGGRAVRDRLRAPGRAAPPLASSITHVAFGGLDHYRSVVELRDALADDVLLADRLDARPLDADHGAPVRLVSPSQYGFMSVKHLCRIDLHAGSPPEHYHPSLRADLPLQAVKPHRRARVWEEERHRHLPAWMVRPVYRMLIPPIRALSARQPATAMTLRRGAGALDAAQRVIPPLYGHYPFDLASRPDGHRPLRAPVTTLATPAPNTPNRV